MIERKCVQCGRKFTIEDSEIEFYENKNLSLPKRCKECRDKNRHSNKYDGKKQNNIHDENNSLNDVRNNNLDNKKNKEGNIEKKGDYKDEKTNSNNRIFKYLLLAVVIIAGLFEGWTNFGIHKLPNNAPSVKNSASNTSLYSFKTAEDCKNHFKKHGQEFEYKTEQQYVDGANKVINSKDALHKKEKEDNDDVYYLKDSNEFVIVSTDGYIRTYFKPSDGINYFNRQ